MARYDNGESYEDYSEWLGTNVYVSRSDCEREILAKRFRKKDDYYIRGDRYSCYRANIEELNFVDSISK